MGLLTPLYLAGLAALSLPLVLHLIRRTPRGRQAFSSLMFLTPSPPRLTRRSRLDHVLLLLSRLTALALLAFAFARPFWRQAALLPLDNLAARRVAVLLDTSASMRRGDLWQQAVSKAEGVLKDLGPRDDVALFTFDDRPHTVVDFVQDASEPTAGKPDLVGQRLRMLGPSFGSTDLAAALVAVASELEVGADVRQTRSEPQLVLITDLARGSRTDALQSYKWPERAPVVAHVLSPKQPTNAAVQLLVDDEEAAAAEPRVRVTNAANSTNDQFFVGWAQSENRAGADEPLATYVPAGQTRVARLPRPTGDVTADRIVLRGDEADFDNTYYVVPPRPRLVKVAWLGDDAADDPRSLRYFFDLAVGDDPLRQVAVRASKRNEPLSFAVAQRPVLVVAIDAIPAQASAALGEYVEQGGMLLAVPNDRAAVESLSVLLSDELTPVGPAADDRGDGTRSVAATLDGEKGQYQLLGEIDFAHPLFVAFANPRYSDFTKIHFWRHRKVAVKENSGTRVVARFDNGDPAILERSLGAGRILVLTSGWQPDDSQLAMSSKFVPLIHGVFDQACGGPVQTVNLTVGQAVPLPAASPPRPVTIEKPDGTRALLSADAKTFAETDQPGIYRLHLASGEYPFAVNIAAAESNTAPMPLENLEQLGVRFASQLTRAERAEKLRQQLDTELENRQQLWRWLIVAAISVLIFETWLAGRTARRLEMELVATT